MLKLKIQNSSYISKLFGIYGLLKVALDNINQHSYNMFLNFYNSSEFQKFTNSIYINIYSIKNSKII